MSGAAKPLTLVSGYLGAGKTTLINHVLASGALGRAAVVVNDFGAVNIDAALIRSTGVDTIELTNGCICCQITDDVQRTMTALAARDDLDHVVCEVSGIGNPAQLGGWRTYPGFRPGGVVVCVDAAVTLKRLRDEFVADLVTAQIRAADLLVVTKADSVSDAQLTSVREACAEITGDGRGNAARDVHREGPGEASGGSGSDVPVEVVRDGDWGPVLRALDALSPGRADGPTGQRAGGPTGERAGDRGDGESAGSMEGPPRERRGTEPDVQAEATSSAHAGTHASATVELQEPVDIARLLQVLTDHAEDLVRAKGVVRSVDGTDVVVQLAGGVVTARPGPDAPERSDGSEGPERPNGTERSAELANRSSLVLIAAGPHAQQALRQAALDAERAAQVIGRAEPEAEPPHAG